MSRRFCLAHACLLLVLMGAFLGLPGCATPPGADASGPSPALAALEAAVVRIDVREAIYDNGAKRVARGVGSGVIMSADGFILTNAHVVSPEAEEIMVTLASLERVEAHLVGWDHWTDLAVIRLDMADVGRRQLQFAHARFGDSRRVQPGQTVYAVGTPNGLARTVTRGIISNTNRFFSAQNQIRGYETGFFNTWLQTDAAINPGNSGGPLVTADGAVVGINTRSYLGAENLSFAVPAATAREVMADLLRHGAVPRSYIGLRPAPLQDLETFFGLQANEGLLVEGVDAGSPAQQAGLRPGEIFLTLNDKPVDGRFPEQLPPILDAIARFPVGRTLELGVKRPEGPVFLQVVTEPLESRVGPRAALDDWGLSIQEVSKANAREQRLDTADGVIVIGLQRAFPAERAGLRVGDIILSVNRQPIASLADVRGLYTAWQGEPGRQLLEVLRQRQVLILTLQP